MNYGAEPADQVVRYTLEGTEFALKISGTAAKNFAVFALAVLRDQKKTHGKTKLVRLLREGKPLKFFSVPTDQMRDFAKAAKSHGLLYVPISARTSSKDKSASVCPSVTGSPGWTKICSTKRPSGMVSGVPIPGDI